MSVMKGLRNWLKKLSFRNRKEENKKRIML